MNEAKHEFSEDGARQFAAQADTGARAAAGNTARLLYIVALCWSLFQLWIASPLPFMLRFGIFTDTQARSIHLAFGIFLAYTAFPAIAASAGKRLHLAGWIYLTACLASAVFAVMIYLGWAGGAPATATAAVAVTLGVVAYAALVPSPLDRVPAVDWILAAVAAVSAAYLYMFHTELAQRAGRPILADLVVAGVGMVLLLEATRRALGPALAVIALAFLVYTFFGPYMPDLIAHRGASFSRVASQMWLSAEGVFGIPLGVSTAFVFLFVLFGALLERAGAGNYFIQVAYSLLGHLRGGPAKAAVVASAMTGVISGSSIANTVTTGTFTIPLMRRVGFRAEKAGAVEVASSVNGQLMPPVMGAAAFLMVEYVGIPYIDVIKHALLPAVISYIALLYIVHLEALKHGLQGIPAHHESPAAQRLIRFGITVSSVIILAGVIYYAIGWMRAAFGPSANIVVGVLVFAAYLGLLWNAARFPELEADDPDSPMTRLPDPKPVINSGLHFILPIVVLVWALMVERLSPGLSAFWAVSFMVFIMVTQRPLLAFFRRQHDYRRAALQGLRDLVDGLVAGARNMVGIAVATAAAGIIVGVVAMTGLGLVLTQVVETISGGNLILMLLFVALLSLILGLGLPTTANYIIVATLMAPIVVDLGAQSGLVIPLIAAHLFVFYFGIMADVTPPVGLASFAAAAISRGDPLRTGVQAFYYSLRTVALPFIFIFNTQLLLIGLTTWWEFVLLIASSTIAMLVFAAATQGWFFTRTRWYEAVALLLVAFTLFRPGYWMDMIQPEFERREPAPIMEVVEATPPGGHIRLWVEGIDADGRDVSKAVMLPLPEGETPQERLRQTGLELMVVGDQVQIMNVRYGSTADRYGLDFGFDVTAILLPADRPPAQLMFIPALALLGLVILMQRKRMATEERRATAPAAASAQGSPTDDKYG